MNQSSFWGKPLLCFFLVLLSIPRLLPAAPEPPGQRAIIFIPGFKGSALDDSAQGKRIWLDARFAFYHVEDLALHITPLEPTALAYAAESWGLNGRTLQVGGVLEEIPVLLGVGTIDIYGQWLRVLRDRLGKKALVVAFAYDWRQDNWETVGQLAQRIEELRHQGFSRIDIVSHSMGGLITAYYLRFGTQDPETCQENWQGAQNLSQVVFSGTPFQGAMEFLLAMQGGMKAPLNSTVIHKESLNTFASIYQLLPRQGLQRAGESVSIFEPKIWQDYGLGLLDANVDLQSRYLARARAFSDCLHAPFQGKPSGSMKVLNVMSKFHPTLARYELSRPVSHAEKKQMFAPGDDLVTFESAQLPPAFSQSFAVQLSETRSRHGWLFKDHQPRQAVLRFLNEENSEVNL